MSEGIIICIIMVVPIIIGVTIGLKKRKRLVRIEDADLPGQIKSIIEQVASDGTGYKAVPAISKQSTGSMIKDVMVSKLTGHSFTQFEPDEKFLLIFGNMKMFFVPVYEDQITKEIKPNFTKVIPVSTEYLSKVKTNESGSSVTLVFEGKEKFLFGTLKNFYFPGASAQTEREQFAEFIHEFESSVNNK